MNKYIFVLTFLFSAVFVSIAGDKITKSDMPEVRKTVAEYIKEHEPQKFSGKAQIEKYLKLLDNNGQFTDINIDHKKIKFINYNTQLNISKQLKEAFIRLRDIAWAYQRKMFPGENIRERILKSVIYYGELELKRKDTRARWTYSSFLLPRYSSIIYFSLYPANPGKERDAGSKQLADSAEKILKKVVFQAFTMPSREDVPDPYSPEHYRQNKAWVGGNFSYRRPFINAAVCNDPELLNTTWTVCNQAISVVSNNTHKEAFWQEGLCADGCAWGHGRQSYAFGYGIDGIGGILRTLRFFNLAKLKNKSLSLEQFQRLIGFADAMTWLQYRDRGSLSILGRHNLTYKKSHYIVRINRYLDNLKLLNPPVDIQKQIDTLQAELKNDGSGLKAGVRYFWNNDDLVMRGKDYYVFVNMISPRSCGPESVFSSSSGVNYNLADGTAVVLKNGDEYDYTVGAWNFAVPPGSTARNVELPKKNIWRGFFSKHNFAGGIGGKTGVAGFVFEKYMDPKVSSYKFNELCGIKAAKAYFMYPGILISLGAGITNKTPNIKGDIITNINQTTLDNSVYCQIDGKKSDTVSPYKISVDLTKAKKAVTIWQKGIGYAIWPSGGNLSIIGDKRKTKWAEINKRNKKYKNMLKEINVFDISINYGKNPVDASYAYLVALQAADLSSVDELVNSGRFKIVSNSKDLQAVYDSKTKTAQMVLYNPGAVYEYNGLRVSVDSPAIIRISAVEDGKFKISAADPTQNPKLKNIILTINAEKIKIDLPGKPFCGKQVDMKISL